MTIDHVAIWTTSLEPLKDYYVKYFNGQANEKYTNKEKLFESYFISFDSGARLELMKIPDILQNLNARIDKRHPGLTHLAFCVDSMEKVTEKARELENDGFKIIRQPRKTGDGYWEFETLDPDNNRIEVSTMFVD